MRVLGVRRTGREDYHAPLSSVEFQNGAAVSDYMRCTATNVPVFLYSVHLGTTLGALALVLALALALALALSPKTHSSKCTSVVFVQHWLLFG